jgi:hypothetical protein
VKGYRPADGAVEVAKYSVPEESLAFHRSRGRHRLLGDDVPAGRFGRLLSETRGRRRERGDYHVHNRLDNDDVGDPDETSS